jgi:DNA-binding transcriptional MerR regulator
MVYNKGMDRTMKTVQEVSKLSGVTIRTLRYYDRIGLLSPAARTEAGYRLYDETALMRLMRILLLKELEIPLKDVKRLLQLSDTEQREAIGLQIKVLELKKERTEKLIALARRLEKGEGTMDFSAFDRSKEEAYAAEAKARWGETAAYREYETKPKQPATEDRLMAIFAGFGALKDGDPASDEAQAKVKALQSFISANYYTCTDKILMGLGQMYAADERFRANIDAAGGEGTAAFVKAAIEAYCGKR